MYVSRCICTCLCLYIIFTYLSIYLSCDFECIRSNSHIPHNSFDRLRKLRDRLNTNLPLEYDRDMIHVRILSTASS